MTSNEYPSVSHFRVGWEKLVDNLKAENQHDAASSLQTAITYTEAMERAVDNCSSSDAMRYVSAVSWNIKGIRENKDIDYAKRKAIVNEFESVMKHNRSRFTQICTCVKK